MQRILVLGAGFAGLWSAVAAARRLDELGAGPGEVEVLVVNRTPWHSIRVRNYEAALDETLVPLADVLDRIGVKNVIAEVTDINVPERKIACTMDGASQLLAYDRLVFALGSRLARPAIPRLETHAFNVDTFEAARRLNEHIGSLPSRPASTGQFNVLVVGAGLTGVEVATEMFGKLRTAIAKTSPSGLGAPARVILADHQAWIGSDMGDARPVIAEALESLGVETRPGVSVASIDVDGATLVMGEKIPAATVVWCAGMQADPLTARFPVARDRLGRVPVDAHLKIEGMPAEFAAGDTAWLPIDGAHASVMSCQHARPMGRFAGYNVVSDLLGQPMLPLHIDWYVTCLDLGPWGAVYTQGWDRQVAAKGAAAKRTKEIINRQRIYPPRSRNRREILDAAAPVVQAPPYQLH
ncbi:MAG: NAD(P)/FAD-dependent oxidoreductase [Methylocella sp.]|nr:MAG: proton-conducting membrane transporter [Hyphomicrobiales bacterium]